jgi:hypothetical protein
LKKSIIALVAVVGIASVLYADRDATFRESVRTATGAPTLAITGAGTTNTVTITGTGASQRLIRVWTAATAYGAPSTNNIETVTLSGGTAIQTVTAHADYIYLTAATGIASASIVGTAAGTNYVMVADGGTVTSAPIVFAE